MLGSGSLAAGRSSESQCACMYACVRACVCVSACVSSFAGVLLPVGVLKASPLWGDLPFVFHFKENDMPPVPKGGAFELDIFPMGILLVWFVVGGGGGWILIFSSNCQHSCSYTEFVLLHTCSHLSFHCSSVYQ